MMLLNVYREQPYEGFSGFSFMNEMVTKKEKKNQSLALCCPISLCRTVGFYFLPLLCLRFAIESRRGVLRVTLNVSIVASMMLVLLVNVCLVVFVKCGARPTEAR